MATTYSKGRVQKLNLLFSRNFPRRGTPSPPLEVNGIAVVEENDFNDTLARDDYAHKAVLCTHSLILGVWLLYMM